MSSSGRVKTNFSRRGSKYIIWNWGTRRGSLIYDGIWLRKDTVLGPLHNPCFAVFSLVNFSCGYSLSQFGTISEFLMSIHCHESCNNVWRAKHWASAWMNVWRVCWYECDVSVGFPVEPKPVTRPTKIFPSLWHRFGWEKPPHHATYWTFTFSHPCGRSEAGRRFTAQRKMATTPWSSGCWRPALRWMQWKMMAVASGRGFWREVWPWLPDNANNVNRTCLLKVGDRLNEFLLLEKPERNMKKPQSFQEI